MSLRKYNNLSCQGSSGPVGIDGWYATGQIWAYIQGEVKVFGAPIFSAGLAAVLQARLPNPFFAQATVGVKVKIGFIKFDKSLSLKLGEDCILVSNDPDDEVGLDIIPYLNPTNGGESIETDAKISGPINVKLNSLVEISTVNGPKNYRVEVLSHKITTDQGIELDHNLVYNYSNNEISLKPTYFLPGNTSITAIIELEIKEDGNVIATQADTTTFVTAPDMEIIPETNIQYVYPIDGMNNFYPEEQANYSGYLKMDAYQSVVVDKLEEDSYMRFTDTDGNTMNVPITYNYLSNKIEFIIGNDLLENGKGYKMELVHYTDNRSITPSAIHYVPPAGTRSVNAGLLSTALGGSTPNLDPPPTTGTTEYSTTLNISEQIFYTSYFRVSEYNTFTEKINDVLVPHDLELQWFTKNIENEGFDLVELEGIKELDPMIEIVSGQYNPQLINIGSFYDDFPAVKQTAPPGCPTTIHFSSELTDPGKEGISRIDYEVSELPGVYETEGFHANLPVQFQEQAVTYSLFKVPSHINQVQTQLRNCALGFVPPEPEVGQTPIPNPIPVNQACDHYPYSEMCGYYGEDVVEWLFVNPFGFGASNGNYPVYLSYRLPGINNTPSSTVTVTFINQ